MQGVIAVQQLLSRLDDSSRKIAGDLLAASLSDRTLEFKNGDNEVLAQVYAHSLRVQRAHKAFKEWEAN